MVDYDTVFHDCNNLPFICYYTMAHRNNRHTTQGSSSRRVIAHNRQVRHHYTLIEEYEAGMVLAGWELKSIRDGRVQLRDSYVTCTNQHAWLVGAHITPLTSVSTHITPDAQRRRKLLLHKRQLRHLAEQVQQQGYTIVVLELHWHRQYVKAQLALAQGKKIYDKRAALKERDLVREQERQLRRHL